MHRIPQKQDVSVLVKHYAKKTTTQVLVHELTLSELT